VRYDVAIIGAGFSGLAAAIRLAHFGRRVVLLEKHSVWGGLNSFYKKGGHHFDTGLHAVTNYVRPGYKGPRLPLQRIARQLRFDLGELELLPQSHSEVIFGDARLEFTNELKELEANIAAQFPAEIDGFRRLAERCAEYPDLSKNAPHVSTRRILREYFRDPLLAEMVLAPVLWYGSAEENDIDFEQFVILFGSIYREGFSRPKRGVRGILDVLMRRLQESGAELRRSSGVSRLEVRDGRVEKLMLEGGDTVEADVILSSAGLVETMRLRSDLPADTHARDIGRLSFVETIWVLKRSPRELGHDACVTFYGSGDHLDWSVPPEAVDVSSGVICCPSNYGGGGEPRIRATHLARAATWFSLEEEAYRAEKERTIALSLRAVEKQLGAFAGEISYVDNFTPRTVKYYTSKENGSIYGSPHKLKTGATDLPNLYLCGTDQGLAGIVGGMLSGINMANIHGGALE
jgi:phytoene dehydrogenase-like protein